MTPKEKAEELVRSFEALETKADEIINDIMLGDLSVKFKREHCKKCALIAVEEVIINTLSEFRGYWQEVKQEIEKC